MNDYYTTDFYTTAVLRMSGYEVKKIIIEKPGGNRKKFAFEDSPELRQIVLDYMNGTIEGNLREFKNAIDNVKDMVHSG